MAMRRTHRAWRQKGPCHEPSAAPRSAVGRWGELPRAPPAGSAAQYTHIVCKEGLKAREKLSGHGRGSTRRCMPGRHLMLSCPSAARQPPWPPLPAHSCSWPCKPVAQQGWSPAQTPPANEAAQAAAQAASDGEHNDTSAFDGHSAIDWAIRHPYAQWQYQSQRWLLASIAPRRAVTDAGARLTPSVRM